MMRIILALVCLVSVASARPSADFKFDPENVNCNSNIDYIDECGLQQGYSHRFPDFGYPTNFTALTASCKRQAEGLKCLRAYSKCLPALPKQVLIAMANSRQKYNKKICSEKQTETATKLIELSQCMNNNKATKEKGIQAELNSIITAEAIVNSKFDNVQDRIKHSCCSVARLRKEYLETTTPHCKQYSQVATDVIDSYLAETVGIICPDFENKSRVDCDKLPKLNTPKSSEARYFIRPIINVIKTLG